MKKIKLPKSISKNESGNYKVRFHCRGENKAITIGTYPTIMEAINARDSYIVNIKDYLPRGVFYCNKRKKYLAYLRHTEGKSSIDMYIGAFNTVSEAVEYRKKFILSLI